ncbi:threonine-phosphate decarboxylase [Bacteroides pyogenes]|uniref:threonine-phosphate decarboxylase n=1 Tax=Bacteroides pyogenes TaxID=310300 RepID=UPI001BAB22C9|nr:threonine-phosphate decarboxylase [Bacteroides pyogenes]MBR8724888.1 Threonine-phosphate decarboxylase [Bacteroides pyogenes]MBR8738442.1 Threonine-phosphate decarboxylase [Bacteroides pyogenes]MBR8754100.1 Threonine-phosphate decarboxylase [Bacteroides pyogenes]MBR8795533.1 Threonine-phosphate decarboxylase [Bacteroides pyogenes]MBR8808836.1 Threonine-phosphate decarboxylase [Bacteroides pyogenes]
MIQGHGDDLYKYAGRIVSNFSSNVYNRVDHSGLYRRLSERLEVTTAYPEPEPYSLEGKIARKYGLSAVEVCVTNGATEAIYLIAQTFRSQTSAVLMPTFSEYADACRLHGHRVKPFFSPEALPDEAGLVWICNPNNPTGEVRRKRLLEELILSHPDCLFVIDQSYEYFTLEPLFTMKEAAAMPNVVLIHSMTKKFAVPGLRIGYFTASESLVVRIRSHRMPWSVNALAIEAGHFLLDEGDRIAADVPALLDESKRLAERLAATGLVEVWPTDTHYMLLRLRIGKASALKEYLAGEHGMLIRDASNFEGLDERFFRIAAQTPEENDRLVEAVGQWGRM